MRLQGEAENSEKVFSWYVLVRFGTLLQSYSFVFVAFLGVREPHQGFRPSDTLSWLNLCKRGMPFELLKLSWTPAFSLLMAGSLEHKDRFGGPLLAFPQFRFRTYII